MRLNYTDDQKQFLEDVIHIIDVFVNLPHKDKPELSSSEFEEIHREITNMEAERGDLAAVKQLVLEELVKFKFKLTRNHVKKIVKIKIEKEMYKKEALELKEEIVRIENNFLWKWLDMVDEKTIILRSKYERAAANFKRLNTQYYNMKNADPVATSKDIIVFKMNIQKILIDL